LNNRTRLCLLALAGLAAWPVAGHARDHLAAARDALQAGDLKTAAIELRNAVRDDPQNAGTRFDLARVELQLGDPVSAERDARAAALRGLEPRKALPLLGEALLAQNRAEDVLKELRPKGEDKALDAGVMVLRGEAALSLGRPDDAASSFKQAETLDPSAIPAWIEDARLAAGRGDIPGALERIDHALAVQPKAMEALVLKAALLRQKGDGAAALALLGQVIAEQPPALAARVERANQLLAAGKLEPARADLDAVLALTPNNIEALFLRAVLLHETHDDTGAEALLQKLDPIFASYPRAFLLRAAVQERNGELQQAEEAAAKYIARVPDDPNGYKLLARLYLEDHRPDLALTPLKQAVQAGKGDALVYDMLGHAYAATGQQAEAAEAYAKADELAPGNIETETALATARIASGQPEKALGGLEATLAKAPANPVVQEAAFSAALAIGELARAERVLEEAKRAAGETAVTQNLTAMLQLARLDAAGAEATLEAAIKAHPDFVPTRLNLVRALAMQGKGEQADAVLSAMLTRAPAAEPALSLLVEERLRTGRAADAIALMERAHAAKPDDTGLDARLGALALQTGTPEKALALAQGAQKGATAPDPQLLLLAANAQLALKQTDAARDTLARLVALEPRAVDARRQLAAVLVERGEDEAARTVIREGMRATPRVYQLSLDYALIDLKASGLDKALATAETLRQQDLGDPALGALRGDVFMAAGKPDEAAKAYAGSGGPSSSLLALRLAAAYQRAGKHEAARATLAGWVGKHPQDATVSAALSEMDLADNRLDAAQTELEAVLAQHPLDPVAMNNLAWVYQLRDNPRARPMAERAYLLAPNPQSADTLGWILARGGDPARALALLRQAAASGDPRIAYHLAVALNDLGQKDDAAKLLTKVAETPGDFTEKTDARALLSRLNKGT
jgi:putative PEP-CTERM system TPR-repeat lipoprotein